jgi:hypothetical protein
MDTPFDLALQFLGYVFGIVLGFILAVYVSILVLESRRRRGKRDETPV